LTFLRIGDRDVPALPLEGVVDEAGPVHRLDDPRDFVALATDERREGAQGVRVRPHRGHLHGPPILIEHMHIESLT
jgi:hypothetical protein